MTTDASGPSIVYLVGTTGHPNYGDELIAAAWLSHLARVAPDSEVWLDCPSPGQSEVQLGHLHPRARFTDTFWRLCWYAPSEEPWEVAAFVQHAVHDPGRAPRWVAGIDLAATADVVHLIGGGYVNGIWPRHVGLLAAAASSVERSGGRAVMTGQGLWPIAEDSGPLLRNLAARFDVVDVRDSPSRDLLAAATPTSATGDDMFFGIGPDLYTAEEPREVMVCLQSDLLEVTVPALAGFLLDTLRGWGVSSEQVGFVEGIPLVDREVYALVEHDVPGARFYPFSEIMRDGLPAAAGQRWLSSRFHTHLVAAATGASGVAVSINSGYYTNKHRSLIERGSNWSLSEGLRIPASPDGGGFDRGDLCELKRAKEELARSIY